MAEKNKLRKYIVYYYAEVNDECDDCEMEIKARTIFDALHRFNNLVKIYKRIFAVIEKPNV